MKSSTTGIKVNTTTPQQPKITHHSPKSLAQHSEKVAREQSRGTAPAGNSTKK